MRKLASIRKISEVRPIEGADAIECVVVDGWTVVSKKGEFNAGDLCVYFEIDSVLPYLPQYEFLTKSCYRKADWLPGGEGFRLKTIKLRGQLSQGLVIPIPEDTKAGLGSQVQEGVDLTDHLFVTKWDPPLPSCLSGQAEGMFPSFIHKTDQERAQNLVNEIYSAFMQETPFEITMKLDGSSCTAFIRDGEVGICSRNLQLKINDANADNSFIRAATDSRLFDALEAVGRNIAVQAELMGPGIQGNREGLPKIELFVFDIFDIDAQRYFTPHERYTMMTQLIANGFTGQHVPVIGIQKLSTGNVKELLLQADGPSVKHAVREGLVWKSAVSDFTFKTISNKFLLKGND